ncbi:hypothetical protein [Burkholderia sp. Ac-20379]|uniref:hypothetical protein n=1 Tax=Burkholderia sp. Ac-20379 TaxID=2703900 RepID=UPI00198024DA|nr:hypothetical protein [Burkholderia sp. Ac-20379]
MSLSSRLLAGCLACALSAAALPALAQLDSQTYSSAEAEGGFIRVNNREDYLRAERHQQEELHYQRQHEETMREERIQEEHVRQERMYEQRMNGNH